ncbi:phosphoenolpyruvate carboxykinase (ATP) [Halobacillus amylolyticus]|uniref:Aldolase n=1 Tax=Halobacillus amylolyticus TaxID=2932259 RepID=A0ABY4HG63_9BACI|nr:aldolase [Halobacillus amylolyticus]UOR13776.1 aldolase [Halobacillus amylolyticus]
MVDTLKRTAYKAFGFRVTSELPLPELPADEMKSDKLEISIEQADLTRLWEKKSKPNRHFVIEQDLCMFKVPNLAIFLIEEGSKITFSPLDNAREDQLRLYILGTCMGAVLVQRKILPLHGSAIAINGKAYAIVGDSGAGKSTLASVFLKKGYPLLSDDVIPVTLSEEDIPIVTPAYPQQKLWVESLNEFGMESHHYKPIIDRENKFAIPVLDQFASKRLPLAGVFELVKTNEDGTVIHPIENLHKLHTLFNHTYRNFMIGRSGLMDWHFNTSAKILSQIDLYQLRRPVSHFTAHELTDLILSTLKIEEKMYD